MNRRCLRWIGILLFSLAVGACDREPANRATGDFSVLARSVEGFSEAQPGHTLEFPRDHGAHPDFRIEWWYLTANLKDAGGHPYGIQWTLFRLARQPQDPDSGTNPWHDHQVYMAHIALTWPEGHVGYQRYARGGVHGGLAQAGVTAVPFSAWLDDWTLRSIGASWLPLEVNARQGDFAFRLSLESEQNLVLQGENGFSRKHADGSGSYYYSQPFLMASGRLSIAGKSIPVSGEAWLDREWSSRFLHPEQAGWDWFALHLDSGEKLMLFRLRQRSGTLDSADVTFGMLIAPGGETKPLTSAQIRFEPLAFERIAGRDLPLKWRIALPELDRDLAVRALIPDQWMYVDFAYWEGAVVVEGDNAGSRGVGYMELTGYPSR